MLATEVAYHRAPFGGMQRPPESELPRALASILVLLPRAQGTTPVAVSSTYPCPSFRVLGQFQDTRLRLVQELLAVGLSKRKASVESKGVSDGMRPCRTNRSKTMRGVTS